MRITCGTPNDCATRASRAGFSGQYVPAGEAIHTEWVIPFCYVLVPDPLIVAFAHDPLAVGVYVAIARLALVAKGAVPVAARELVAWMGSDRDADRAAIMRRIAKLAEDDWLSIERTAAAKYCLLPTWGRDQSGTVRSWRFDTADSGRPGHLRGRRLPIALFDTYLGRLDPRPGHGRALISRYFTRPLLDLVDIGVYTIGLRAEATPTLRLRHFELHNEEETRRRSSTLPHHLRTRYAGTGASYGDNEPGFQCWLLDCWPAPKVV